MNTNEGLEKAFKKANLVEMGFMAFEERINSLNIDPFRTNEKLRAARYKGLAYLMRPIKENKWTRDNRV